MCKTLQSLSWGNFVYKLETSKLEIGLILFLLFSFFIVSVTCLLFYMSQKFCIDSCKRPTFIVIIFNLFILDDFGEVTINIALIIVLCIFWQPMHIWQTVTVHENIVNTKVRLEIFYVNNYYLILAGIINSTVCISIS